MDPNTAPDYVGIGSELILTIIFIGVSITYFTSPQPWTIIDGADLLFHEAGHSIFAFAGQFIMILGGSLTQILVPIAIGLYFLSRKSWLSSLFCVYWMGINLINVGVYIADASAMNLPLINDGAIHDWNYLLSNTGLLSFDQLIGNGVRALGTMSIVIAEVAMVIHLTLVIIKKRDSSRVLG